MNHLASAVTATNIIFALDVLTGVCVLLGAYYAYRAARVEVRPVWDDDPSLEPKNIAMHTFGMTNALEAANFWAGRLGRKAGLWGIAAGLLVVVSLIAKNLT